MSASAAAPNLDRSYTRHLEEENWELRAGNDDLEYRNRVLSTALDVALRLPYTNMAAGPTYLDEEDTRVLAATAIELNFLLGTRTEPEVCLPARVAKHLGEGIDDRFVLDCWKSIEAAGHLKHTSPYFGPGADDPWGNRVTEGRNYSHIQLMGVPIPKKTPEPVKLPPEPRTCQDCGVNDIQPLIFAYLCPHCGKLTPKSRKWSEKIKAIQGDLCTCPPSDGEPPDQALDMAREKAAAIIYREQRRKAAKRRFRAQHTQASHIFRVGKPQEHAAPFRQAMSQRTEVDASSVLPARLTPEQEQAAFSLPSQLPAAGLTVIDIRHRLGMEHEATCAVLRTLLASKRIVALKGKANVTYYAPAKPDGP